MANANTVSDAAKASATASPLPLAGEGQGGGRHEDSRKHALSPPLPRKRGREQTEFVAPIAASISSAVVGGA
jgi:hypothetical protein